MCVCVYVCVDIICLYIIPLSHPETNNGFGALGAKLARCFSRICCTKGRSPIRVASALLSLLRITLSRLRWRDLYAKGLRTEVAVHAEQQSRQQQRWDETILVLTSTLCISMSSDWTGSSCLLVLGHLHRTLIGTEVLSRPSSFHWTLLAALLERGSMTVCHLGSCFRKSRC